MISSIYAKNLLGSSCDINGTKLTVYNIISKN